MATTTTMVTGDDYYYGDGATGSGAMRYDGNDDGNG